MDEDEDPAFRPVADPASIEEALKAEVTRVRFAVLLQLMRSHAARGAAGCAAVELHGERLFGMQEAAEAVGVAAPTEEFTEERRAWRASLLRVGAEAFTRAGSSEAPKRWRDVVEACRGRERETHMKMGLAKPTELMRSDTADALLGLAAALHPPWQALPAGLDRDSADMEAELRTVVDQVEEALRESLEIIGQLESGRDAAAGLGAVGATSFVCLPDRVGCLDSSGILRR